MKESYYFWRKILTQFFNDVLKYTLILYVIAFLIVFAVNTWRNNLLAYIIAFLICFGINWFRYFRKEVVKNEFKENQ